MTERQRSMPDKKKIAIITNGAFPVPAVRGGAVEALVEMILGQNEKYREAEITVFSIYDELALKAGTKYPSIHFEFVRPEKAGVSADRFLHYIAADLLKRNDHLAFKTIFQRLSFLYQTAVKINETHYDRLIFENQMASLWILKYKDNQKKYAGKYYFHLHNHPAKYAGAEELVKESRRIICVSSFIGHAFAKNIGDAYDGRYAVLTNVVDENLFDPESVTEDQKQSVIDKLQVGNRKVILFLGRLMEGKGVRELLQAYQKIADDSNVLVVVGSFNFNDSTHSPYEDELNRLINEIGREHIIFTGYVNHDEVPAYYQIADVVCMPSTCEDAAPLAVIECLRMQKPLITTTMGGIPEYADSSCAVMLENDEHLVEHIAESLTDLLNNPEKCALMSENAGRVSQSRTLSSYYHNLLEILEL